MTWALAPAGLVSGRSMLNTVRIPISRRAAITCFIAVWSSGAYRNPIPTSSTQRATLAGGSSRLIPSVSTTSAEPHREETERLPCLATFSPAPATTKAVAVETLNVPAASPPVPQVSISISRSVPVRAATSSPWVFTRTAFWRMTWAKPISSSTVSPFIRSAVRKAAIWALVAAPDMIASMAAAASMRLRSFLSISARSASVMIGLVMPPFPLQRGGRKLDAPSGDQQHRHRGGLILHGPSHLPAVDAGHGEVGEDDVKRLGLEAPDGLGAVGDEDRRMPPGGEDVPQHLQHRLLVVHHQAAERRHGLQRRRGRGVRPARAPRERQME